MERRLAIVLAVLLFSCSALYGADIELFGNDLGGLLLALVK